MGYGFVEELISLEDFNNFDVPHKHGFSFISAKQVKRYEQRASD